MANFEQLKLIYNQFFMLADEIKSMINNEEYNEVISKLQHKDALIENLAKTKKNIELSEEETQEIIEIEAKFLETEKCNLDFLTSLHADVAIKLKEVNSCLKINKAYSKKDSQQAGSILDFSE